MSMVSISRFAPASLRICRVAAMISGPMPSPCATVIGTDLDIRKKGPFANWVVKSEAIYSIDRATGNQGTFHATVCRGLLDRFSGNAGALGRKSLGHST